MLAEEPFADDPQAGQRQLAGCLRSLLDQLAEPYRSAVTAVDLDGETQTDVAPEVGAERLRHEVPGAAGADASYASS